VMMMMMMNMVTLEMQCKFKCVNKDAETIYRCTLYYYDSAYANKM